MRIDPEIRLDYKDVLIRPKRSTLQSRRQVKLERKFEFRNYNSDPMIKSSLSYTGIPIMASNMDGVGTFEMANKLSEMDIFTCLVKTYDIEELIEFFNNTKTERNENVAISIGSSDTDFLKLVEVQSKVGCLLYTSDAADE